MGAFIGGKKKREVYFGEVVGEGLDGGGISKLCKEAHQRCLESIVSFWEQMQKKNLNRPTLFDRLRTDDMLYFKETAES